MQIPVLWGVVVSCLGHKLLQALRRSDQPVLMSLTTFVAHTSKTEACMSQLSVALRMSTNSCVSQETPWLLFHLILMCNDNMRCLHLQLPPLNPFLFLRTRWAQGLTSTNQFLSSTCTWMKVCNRGSTLVKSQLVILSLTKVSIFVSLVAYYFYMVHNCLYMLVLHIYRCKGKRERAFLYFFFSQTFDEHSL